jgi:hypothetical protein
MYHLLSKDTSSAPKSKPSCVIRIVASISLRFGGMYTLPKTFFLALSDRARRRINENRKKECRGGP